MDEEKHYFTIKELTKSDTAYRMKINNTPSPEIKKNLHELIDTLDGIREAWGGPIKVNSGYRCPKLNKAVGGSETSVHMIGFAADLRPASGEIGRFKEFIKEYLIDNHIEYDQCIIEKSGRTQWVHFGLYNNAGKQRKMLFRIEK